MVLALGLGSLHAGAQGLDIERVTFEDPSGRMTFEQVQQADFSRTGSVISRGYLPEALWIRLTVEVPGDTPALVIQITSAALEDVTLFYAGATPAGPSASGAVGRRLPHRSSWVKATPGKNHFYLQIKTPSPMLVSANVLTPAQAQQEDIQRAMVLGAVIACCAPLAIAVLMLLVMRREPLHGLFLLNLCISIAFFFAWESYCREFFGPDSLIGSSTAVHFLGLSNIFTAFLFFRALLGRFGLPEWGRQLFILFFVLYTPLFWLFFLINRQPVLLLSSMLGMLASALCLVVTLVMFRRQKHMAWFIATLIVFAMILLLKSLLTTQGLLAADALTVHLAALRIFFLTGFFISIFILMDRDKKNLIQASVLKETVARRLAESEKNRRETQERFMTMLMHELKTPLAIIQLAATSLGRHLAPGSGDATRITNIKRSVDDLNTLIERCAQADQIDQGAATLDKKSFSLNSLTDDLLRTLGADRIRLVGEPAGDVVSDYHYLRMVLLNLLSNALKYSPPDTPVIFKIERSAGRSATDVHFSVTNSVGAAGLPDPASVFTRYYRAEAARGQVGAGLGLWLAQAVARQFGSEVVFQADPKQVVFSFGLYEHGKP